MIITNPAGPTPPLSSRVVWRNSRFNFFPSKIKVQQSSLGNFFSMQVEREF
jgi:hypothetical protein